MAQQPIEGQSLPIDCWPVVQLSADRSDHGQFRGDWSARREPQALVGFQDRDCRYQSAMYERVILF